LKKKLKRWKKKFNTAERAFIDLKATDLEDIITNIATQNKKGAALYQIIRDGS
jgi:hypothetical protein